MRASCGNHRGDSETIDARTYFGMLGDFSAHCVKYATQLPGEISSRLLARLALAR
jgi:hypothetical protein